MKLQETAVEAYLGLGSNLGDSIATLKSACLALAAVEGIQLLAVSAFYRSRPVGPQDQPDYVNAAIRIGTKLSAEALLDALHIIENQHGRVRTQHWGPRTLDLDILLYDDQQIQTQRLRVPHPEIPFRGFVLYPLQEIAPADLHIPGLDSLRNLLASCPQDGLEKIDS